METQNNYKMNSKKRVIQFQSYKLYNSYVDLFTKGNVVRLWFNEWSGKIIYRYKLDTISNVKHPGIFIGFDKQRNNYYMHNHFEHGRPIIEIEQGFAKGQQLYISTRQSKFGVFNVIQNALKEVVRDSSYNWNSYNCQTCVNRVCFNENKSESIESWAKGILAGLFFIAGTKAFSNSK